MTRSLRLRFFLITWPLIVLAVAAVAFTFGRWTDVRLTEQHLGGPGPAGSAARSRVDSLVARWAEGRATDAVLAGALAELGRRDSIDVIVVNARGAIAASSDSGIRLEQAADSLPGPGPLTLVRSSTVGGLRAEQMMQVTGRPARDASGALRGRVYQLPRTEPEPPPAAVLRAEARRTLWIAAAIASAVAALLAVALAGPLVAQIGRLAAASGRVRSGDLAARVRVGAGDELGRLEAAFNAMADSLERAELHQRNLVHDVAHELRTPLTNVRGMLEAIEDGLRAPDEATLAILRSETALLVGLVDDLQDLNLAESGQLPFALESVDVTAESVAAVEAMRARAEGVRLEAPAGGPVRATADPRRLRQVLRNLLSNALTHTPAGGRVAIEIHETPGEVGILVSDTGRGIPAEHLELIWERFHRVDASRDRAGGGRGLGLAIVRQFAEGMGGRVAAHSVEGRGSRFEIWLPARPWPQVRG